MIKAILYVSGLVVGVMLALFYPVMGAVLNIETYLMNPPLILQSSGVELGIRYQLVAAIAFMLGLVLNRQGKVPAVGLEGFVLQALWVYTGIALLSSQWALVNPAMAWDWAYDFSKTVLVSALFVLAIRSERDMTIIVWACIIGITHAAFMHVIGPKIGWISESQAAKGVDEGVLSDYQGSVLLIFVPTFILSAVYSKRWFERLYCWLALPLVLDSIANTYGRTMFLGLLVQSGLLLIFLPKRIILRVLPVLAFGLLLFVFGMTPADYWDRMSTILNPEGEGSANSRFIINDASMRMLADYPWGVGYRNYPLTSPRYLPQEMLTSSGDLSTQGGVRSAHNSYFTIACETGVQGFIPWAAAFGGTALLLRRIRRRADIQNLNRLEIYAMGFELGLYGWLISGWTQALHQDDPPYWFIAFAVVLTRLCQRARAQSGATITGSCMRLPR